MSSQGSAPVCKTALLVALQGTFLAAQEHFIAYYKCKEAIKLFRFFLPPL
jgi:hypothetical protein